MALRIQALYERGPFAGSGLICHADRGSQYVSIRDTERLAEVGIGPSVGRVGASYDNALGLDGDRPVQGRGNPSARAVAVLRGGRVRHAGMGDWFNHRRLLEPIGNVPPAEAEARDHAQGRGPSLGRLIQTKQPPENSERFNRFLLYAQAFSVQLAYTVLCNGHFTIDQRLARWVLMSHDRADREDVPLTHGFLSLTLGVRRAGVTTALRSLEGTGAIKARYGGLTIRDRNMLLDRAGDGYGATEGEYARIMAPS
jgi:hypothetical protein